MGEVSASFKASIFSVSVDICLPLRTLLSTSTDSESLLWWAISSDW